MKYLYAVVLRQLGSYEVARKQLVEAIEEEPCLWCFWYELSDCVLTRQDLAEVLPQLKFHWMRDFFLARTYALLNMTEDAHGAYKYLRKTMFSNTSYVLTELAKACFAKREVLESAKLMEKVRAMEPIRLDDMCFYSNVLHARGDKVWSLLLIYPVCCLNLAWQFFQFFLHIRSESKTALPRFFFLGIPEIF